MGPNNSVQAYSCISLHRKQGCRRPEALGRQEAVKETFFLWQTKPTAYHEVIARASRVLSAVCGFLA